MRIVSLPKLRLDASESRDRTLEALKKLPPPVSDNPSADLLRMVTAFSNDFRNYINGISDFADLIQKCKPAYEEFRVSIKQTMPDFRPYTAMEYEEHTFLTVDFADPEDAEDSEKLTIARAVESAGRPPSVASSEDTNSSNGGKPMYVDEIKTCIDK